MIITELSAGPELDELAARASAITAAASQARVGNGALTWQPAEIAADLRHQVPSVLHRWLLLSDGDHDLAVRYYSRGYYYDAKRKGLLEETGLRPARSRMPQS